MHRKETPRLYIAYYARPKHPDIPHQALMIGMKSVFSGKTIFTKYHIKNTLQVSDAGKATQPWVYKSTKVNDIMSEDRLLALVCVGKVSVNFPTAAGCLEGLPIHQPDDSPDNQDEETNDSFNCVSWVANAITTLNNKHYIRNSPPELSSDETQQRIMQFIQTYGRWGKEWEDNGEIPILDLLAA
jgi:hypothetical protein